MTSKKKVTTKFQKPGKKPTSVAMKTPKTNNTSRKPRIGVLIADDHPLFRHGLTTLLNASPDFEVVGEATSGEEVVTTAAKLQPDVVAHTDAETC